MDFAITAEEAGFATEVRAFMAQAITDEMLDRAHATGTIHDWDFLLINDHEARMLSGENNLRKAAVKILDMGPNTLVIKRGEYGAMLFRRDSYFIVPGYLLDDVFDPTGATRVENAMVICPLVSST